MHARLSLVFHVGLEANSDKSIKSSSPLARKARIFSLQPFFLSPPTSFCILKLFMFDVCFSVEKQNELFSPKKNLML
jgi:hypothetical protein